MVEMRLGQLVYNDGWIASACLAGVPKPEEAGEQLDNDSTLLPPHKRPSVRLHTRLRRR